MNYGENHLSEQSNSDSDSAPVPKLNQAADWFVSKILSGRDLQWETMQQDMDSLPDEALFANIASVAERIQKAMYSNEPMVIFGHDDPDGVTSTFILYKYLNSCGYQRHQYYIPNRQIESHGIQKNFIEYVRKGGYKLVITVDNGISSSAGVDELNAMGCDVIITDHHLIQPDTLPDAYTILNPQLPECEYPFKPLAGVGVVMMLIRYLSKVWEHPLNPSYYFWTAVGSIADKVPLVGVNWLLVRYAIEYLDQNRDSTIAFLMRNYMRISTKMDAYNFIQSVARLIANGREDKGQHTAIRFMLQLSDDKAILFQDLEKQKNTWENDLNRVFKFLDTLTADFVGNAFIYYDDDDFIPYSLLGTAASYIVNHLSIPTIMLKMHNGNIVCEGRCSDGFNMVNSFTACKEHLSQYGGHPKAAGFVMPPAHYDSFVDCFNAYLTEQGNTLPLAQTNVADVSVNLEDFSPELWKQYESLLPFGQKNPEPLIRIPFVTVSELSAKFNLEFSCRTVPQEKKVDVNVNWKNYGVIRIIDFELCKI